MSDSSDWLPLLEAAQRLGKHPRTLERRAKSGTINTREEHGVLLYEVPTNAAIVPDSQQAEIDRLRSEIARLEVERDALSNQHTMLKEERDYLRQLSAHLAVTNKELAERLALPAPRPAERPAPPDAHATDAPQAPDSRPTDVGQIPPQPRSARSRPPTMWERIFKRRR